MTTARLSTDGIFYTLRGEGPLLGVPSVFVRLDTCNLKCRWGDVLCDAHYTSWTPNGRALDLDYLRHRTIEKMMFHNCKHLVITGGEPALQPHVVRALASIHYFQTEIHTTIETNGTRFVEDHGLDLICLSPKLSGSTPVGSKFEKVHERNRWQPEIIKAWMHSAPYYFKFVINTEDDVEEVKRMLEEVGQPLDPENVLFMPQGIDDKLLWEKSRWLAEVCKHLGVRFTPRIQISIWGNKPGT